MFHRNKLTLNSIPLGAKQWHMWLSTQITMHKDLGSIPHSSPLEKSYTTGEAGFSPSPNFMFCISQE